MSEALGSCCAWGRLRKTVGRARTHTRDLHRGLLSARCAVCAHKW